MSATTNRFELVTLEKLQEIYDILSTSPPGAAVWGTITGTLSSQLDLQAALNLKYDASNPAGYITSAALSGYLTIASAAATYYPLTNPSGYITISALSGYLTSATAAATYYPLTNPAGYTSNTGTVTSVQLAAGTGISLSGTNPITTSGTITVTNSAPDQTVTLSAGTGIGVSGTYPSFTISNTDPTSGVSLSSAGGTETLVNDGTGPSLATKGLTAGTGISLSGSATAVTVTNSAPDQTVALTAGTGISTSGTYPNFTIATNGVALNKQSVIDGTAITGTTVSTLTSSILIPANTVTTGDILYIKTRVRKTGTAGTLTTRMYVNTSAAIGGSLIGTSASAAATTLMFQYTRSLAVKSATNSETMAGNLNVNADDNTAVTTAVSANNIDWTQNQYIVIAVQNGSTADSSRSSFIQCQINKA